MLVGRCLVIKEDGRHGYDEKWYLLMALININGTGLKHVAAWSPLLSLALFDLGVVHRFLRLYLRRWCLGRLREVSMEVDV